MAVLLHVDMDAFFASVELLSHPEWKGKPLIVGAGPHERGVVSTCSYEARKFGVHSAMPSREAYRLCPHAIFTPPDMKAYSAVSRKVFEVFSHYTPYVEGVSIDEAFLDVTGSLHLHSGATDAERAVSLAEALRAEVKRECGVTCSVGIAANRLMAKIGSEQNKPDGLTLMPLDAPGMAAFLAPKPIGTIWGVGKRTESDLARFGIRTCGDLQRLGYGTRIATDDLVAMAHGISDDKVYWQEREAKSVSREWTFDVDETDRAKVRERYLALVDDVGRAFRKEPRWAKTARLKLRDSSFATVTRQEKFSSPARDTRAFRRAALALFDTAWPSGASRPIGAGLKGAVRLIGFGVSDFTPAPGSGELSLFGNPGDDAREKSERISAVLDRLQSEGYHVASRTSARSPRHPAKGLQCQAGNGILPQQRNRNTKEEDNGTQRIED